MSQINDLLEDLEFIRWVKNPDNELTAFWQRWMQANPERIDDVKLAREIILGMRFSSARPKSGTKEEILSKILKETSPSKGKNTDSGRNRTDAPGRNFLQLIRVAAIISGILLLSWSLLNWDSDTDAQESTKPVKWITKSTNAGEKLNFRLPDQSLVWLNSKSKLSFPESFDSTVRLVILEGEGFFEVAEDSIQPFQVYADSLMTTALGTSFNVLARDNEELKVSLVTGKVKINYQRDSISYYLTPGKELKYNTGQSQASINPFNQERVTGWRFGQLIFKSSSLQEVQSKLEAWYGVEISIKGTAHRNWRFTGKFENQTLENVLISMSNIEDFRYTIKNKEVSIIFNP